MAPGGFETSVFQNTIVPESAHVDISFGTPGMRFFKLILKDTLYRDTLSWDVLSHLQWAPGLTLSGFSSASFLNMWEVISSPVIYLNFTLFSECPVTLHI